MALYSSQSNKPVIKHKKYLIALEETRSVIALITGILILFITLGAIFYMIEITTEEENSLHYFTVLSNLLSACGAAFMVPFAVEGIRKKRFIMPRWLILFQYSGATCVAITMVTSIGLILPIQGIDAMSGANFWLHIITPGCTVILFQSVETGMEFSRREMITVLIPYWLYMAVYFVMVVLVGKENGGWSDFYMAMAFWPAWISLVLMLGMGFAVSAVMRVIHNQRAYLSQKRITKAWTNELEPVMLLTEAFGLGRYIGSKCPREELTIPLDIFTSMSEKYDVSLEKLVKAYVKGALDAVEERNNN